MNQEYQYEVLENLSEINNSLKEIITLMKEKKIKH